LSISTTAFGRSGPGGRLSPPTLAAILISTPAQASGKHLLDIEPAPVLLAALILCLALGVATIAFMRRRSAARERELALELERTRAELDRVKQFLAGEAQVVVVWDRAESEPRVEGEFALVSEAMNPRRILTFSAWLDAETAARVEEATAKLLSRGEGFSLTVSGLKGRHFELVGRAIGGNAVMRIRDISGDRAERMRLQERLNEAEAALAGLRKLLDALPYPAWMRGRDGSLSWRSAAFAAALEPKNGKPLDAAAELFDRVSLREAEEARHVSGLWRARVHATVAGVRRPFEAFEVAGEGGAAGLAIDLSDSERLRTDKDRLNGAYKSLLDRLATAVAIFDSGKRLDFYNAAYSQIWSLDAAFLDQRPTDGEILDHLRARRLLPEQADFRAWKAQMLATYQSTEPVETVWHLPDGRALRVSAGPNAEGGVTYLYDDATQSFALATQLNALTRLQGETLDALKEGVAVFGADGRLRLSNPAFAAIWGVEAPQTGERPHFDDISKSCQPRLADPGKWEALRGAALGLDDERRPVAERIERSDGAILECAALPLPDGGTLMTFVDMTDSAKAERALTERNEALVSAERLRNAFVKHVSYELRTPLTNIIGFTQLLADGGAGALSPKQLEYAGYIRASSSALLAIINDILDLASIDAGALELRLEDVDVADAMKLAAEGVQDRLSEAHIELRIVATDGVGKMRADGRRVRQVLFNLLSNAINFSEPGQTVTLAAMRRPDEIVFKVSDRGRGIPPEALEKVFDRFEANAGGARHRGPGLGLSIVRALVELHGGRVTIDSVVGEGTVVTCVFPTRSAGTAALAAS
jgi:signal transduction histidine kinase